MASNLSKVKEFHEAANLDVAQPLNSSRIGLRARLIEEECWELEDELTAFTYEPDSFSPEDCLKELADVLYVVYGTAVTFGWDLEEAFNRVHESNMTKIKNGSIETRSDGKINKGPNYRPPVLSDLV